MYKKCIRIQVKEFSQGRYITIYWPSGPESGPILTTPFLSPSDPTDATPKSFWDQSSSPTVTTLL